MLGEPLGEPLASRRHFRITPMSERYRGGKDVILGSVGWRLNYISIRTRHFLGCLLENLKSLSARVFSFIKSSPPNQCKKMEKAAHQVPIVSCLDLPYEFNVTQIDLLAIYSFRFRVDYGHVQLSNLPLHLPPYVPPPRSTRANERSWALQVGREGARRLQSIVCSLFSAPISARILRSSLGRQVVVHEATRCGGGGLSRR